MFYERTSPLTRQLTGIASGPLLALLILSCPCPEGLQPIGQRALAGTVWITAW